MTLPLEVPRVYTSFADFEREELQRLGLTAWPASPAPITPPASTDDPPAKLMLRLPRTTVRPVLRPAPRVTPASLRAEGILEMGCATGTSLLFVRTRVKLHLIHATWLPDRHLDDYAVRLAVTWIEDHGLHSCTVAKNLGVSETTLRGALAAAGYARLTPLQSAQRIQARSKIGNRRDRLVRTTEAANA
jgi:hypothetical protein